MLLLFTRPPSAIKPRHRSRKKHLSDFQSQRMDGSISNHLLCAPTERDLDLADLANYLTSMIRHPGGHGCTLVFRMVFVPFPARQVTHADTSSVRPRHDAGGYEPTPPCLGLILSRITQTIHLVMDVRTLSCSQISTFPFVHISWGRKKPSVSRIGNMGSFPIHVFDAASCPLFWDPLLSTITRPTVSATAFSVS